MAKHTTMSTAKQWDELWTAYVAALRAGTSTADLKAKIRAWHTAQGWETPPQFA